jgi:hypothetical protein
VALLLAEALDMVAEVRNAANGALELQLRRKDADGFDLEPVTLGKNFDDASEQLGERLVMELKAGIDAAARLADGVARRGGTPVIVLLTDGRANVARDGTGGRARAELDALEAARRLRAGGHAALLIDTSPQPQAQAGVLAAAMAATYVPLPRADAKAIARPVQLAAATRRGTGRAR